MNSPLRRVGVVILILFGLLFLNLNWVQAYKADEYLNSPLNARVQLAEYQRQRGVVEAQGKALALSGSTNDELKYQRRYPYSELYAHIVGYKPVNMSATNIEQSENQFLAGTSDQLFAERFRGMITGRESGGGNVLLTMSLRAQQVAFNELKNNGVAERGAVIAIDPRTGALQALASFPSFDPNPLVSHDTTAAQAAYDRLAKAPNSPLKNRALAEVLPPGSTFKVLVSAAALQAGYNVNTAIPAGPVYKPPQTTQVIRNAVPSICPQAQVTLISALTQSCNTGFAQLGVKLGAARVKAAAQAFGFGDKELTVGQLGGRGLPVAASETGAMSRTDGGGEDPAAVAQSSIGQRDVRMTPLQGAMIAAAIANDGKQMRPYVVQQLLGPDRLSLYAAAPELLRTPVSPAVAANLRAMMQSVVANGTGRNAQIDGVQVGGKTGTAENGNAAEHGWFIGYVIRDGVPISAVAVSLENAGESGSGTATRIAGKVMRAVLADTPRGGQ